MKPIVYSLIVLSLCAACSDDPDYVEPPPPVRTVIAYLCGDNNLSSEINTKIEALQQGMKNVDARNPLIVYADYNDAMPKLIKVTSSSAEVLEQYAERNLASPAHFTQVLQKIMDDFPAQSYGLICFSHASGWLPTGALNNPAGFAGITKNAAPVPHSIFEDESHEMSLNDFAAAIPPTPSGGKFDFILFETCYMAGVEVAYALRSKTKYMLASSAEMLSNGFVEIYPEHLTELFEPEAQLTQFATAYFNYWNGRQGAARAATISLLDLSGMEELATAFHAVSGSSLATDIAAIQHFNRNAYHLFFDLSDYVYTAAEAAQKTAYDNALARVVCYEAATPQFMPGYAYSFSIRTHCGLTVYIRQDDFAALNSAYDEQAWSNAK
ncbi:MAG: hypothetical protein LBT48_06205 [Prevotellaceae bacterium]|jgi:hypothetical protein|nr:hypothetical protein [Prevotellaceae bacterium]